jgi:hypothetical protein
MKYFSFFTILFAIIISFGLFVAGCGKDKEEANLIGFWGMEGGGGSGSGPFSPSASGTTEFEFMPNGKFYYARGINTRLIDGKCRAYGLQNGGLGIHTNNASDTLNYYIENDHLFLQRHSTPFDFNTPLVWYEYEILSIRNCALKNSTQIRLKAINEYAKNQMGDKTFKLMKKVKYGGKNSTQCLAVGC